MRRREFLWLSGLAVAASTPGSVWAQQTAKVYRIAIISQSTPPNQMTETGFAQYRAFLGELRRLGYVEGQNLVVERFSSVGDADRYREMMSDVVRSNPDAVLTTSLNPVLDLKAQTRTIPIVGYMPDPMALGIVPSVARPGGNITGVYTAFEIWGKCLGLLKEAIPTLSHVGLLIAPTLNGQRIAAVLEDRAGSLSISLVGPRLDDPLDETAYQRAFAMMAQERVQGVYVGYQAENFANLRLIVALAEKHRLPAMYSFREAVKIGGFIAYAPDFADAYLHAADTVAEILKGTKPGDIPFYQATKYDLIINLKTAKALGIEISPNLLARADEVIE
jgi:putative ABC transport system substrate-binding protein